MWWAIAKPREDLVSTYETNLIYNLFIFCFSERCKKQSRKPATICWEDVSKTISTIFLQWCGESNNTCQIIMYSNLKLISVRFSTWLEIYYCNALCGEQNHNMTGLVFNDTQCTGSEKGSYVHLYSYFHKLLFLKFEPVTQQDNTQILDHCIRHHRHTQHTLR